MNQRKMDDPDELEELDPDDIESEEEDPEAVDKDVKDIFEEVQNLDYGREDLQRKLELYTDRTPELTGGDIDASWEYADVGEETVGGQNPTPDQSVVDEGGEAVGLTYQDNEPLAIDDKVGERDREPWELNPASSPDYSERLKEEFQAPLRELGIIPEQDTRIDLQKRKGERKSPQKPGQIKSKQRAKSSTPSLSVKRAEASGGRKNAKGSRTGNRTARGNSPRKTQRTKGSGNSVSARP